MDLEGLGMPGPGSFGAQGAKALPALIALEEALLLLGLTAGATPAAVRSAHRATLAELQAQLNAGTLDRPGFRALVDDLDVAVRSALAGTRSSTTTGPTTGPTASGAPTNAAPINATPTNGAPPNGASANAAPGHGVPPHPVPAHGVPEVGVAPPGQDSGSPGSAPAAEPRPPATPSSPAAPTHPEASTAPAAPGPRSPHPAATPALTALTSMPLLNRTPPTRAQHELWTAVLVPTAGQHVEAATTLAASAGPRTDPQWTAALVHAALTLTLADLPPTERRALLPLATGVYAQLENVLPPAVLAGLPARDLLGGLPLQLWAPGLEVRMIALVAALVAVSLAIWTGLR